jgi:hypothetical protein
VFDHEVHFIAALGAPIEDGRTRAPVNTTTRCDSTASCNFGVSQRGLKLNSLRE